MADRHPLALGAVGDVLLETHGMIAGGTAFFGGHLVASWLYWRNREGRPWAVPALMLATAGCAYWVVATPGSGYGIAVYAAGLGLMAGTALASRFARAGAGHGALLFVAGADVWLGFAGSSDLAPVRGRSSDNSLGRGRGAQEASALKGPFAVLPSGRVRVSTKS